MSTPEDPKSEAQSLASHSPRSESSGTPYSSATEGALQSPTLSRSGSPFSHQNHGALLQSQLSKETRLERNPFWISPLFGDPSEPAKTYRSRTAPQSALRPGGVPGATTAAGGGGHVPTMPPFHHPTLNPWFPSLVPDPRQWVSHIPQVPGANSVPLPMAHRRHLHPKSGPSKRTYDLGSTRRVLSSQAAGGNARHLRKSCYSGTKSPDRVPRATPPPYPHDPRLKGHGAATAPLEESVLRRAMLYHGPGPLQGIRTELLGQYASPPESPRPVTTVNHLHAAFEDWMQSFRLWGPIVLTNSDGIKPSILCRLNAIVLTRYVLDILWRSRKKSHFELGLKFWYTDVRGVEPAVSKLFRLLKLESAHFCAVDLTPDEYEILDMYLRIKYLHERVEAEKEINDLVKYTGSLTADLRSRKPTTDPVKKSRFLELEGVVEMIYRLSFELHRIIEHDRFPSKRRSSIGGE